MAVRPPLRLMVGSTIASVMLLTACSTSGSATNPTASTTSAPTTASTTTEPTPTTSTTTSTTSTKTPAPTTTTRPPTTPDPTPSSERPNLADLVGDWDGHGRHLTIDGAGHFQFAGRTYVTCGEGPPPCDSVVGNAISDGAVANGVIISRGGNVAAVQVTSTNDTDYVPRGTASFVYDPANDTLTIQPTDVSLCGPSAGLGVCGA